MERPVKRYVGRTPNAFFLFSNENRRKLIEENPGIGNKNISQILGILWSQLDSDKKQEFVTKAQQLKDEHKKEKEFSGNAFNLLTDRRLRDRQMIARKTTPSQDNSLKNRIVWRPITLLQMTILTNSEPEPQPINDHLEVEPISEEKRGFMKYLGLCQRNSTEYRNIMAKQLVSARNYPIYALIQTVRIRGRKQMIKTKTEVTNKDQDQVKRPRGRPRKYFPVTDVQKK